MTEYELILLRVADELRLFVASLRRYNHWLITGRWPE